MMNNSLKMYLISLLIDNFEFYHSLLMDFQNNKYDNFFFDENGNSIDDAVIFFTKSKELIVEEVIDALYSNLVDLEDELLYPLAKIVNYLCKKYTTYCYKDKSAHYLELLKSEKSEDIVEFFRNDYDFGMELLTKALNAMVDITTCNKNLGEIISDGNISQINKWFDKDELFYEGSQNDDLRDSICHLYDYLTSIGCSNKDSLKYVWQFFERNFDPTGIVNKYGDENKPNVIKYEILKLMYADIYEDVCNDGISKYITLEERKMLVIVIIAVYFNWFVIPDEEMRKIFLNKFLNLRFNFEQRKENRSETYKNNRVNILKKVNPSYKYDELTF